MWTGLRKLSPSAQVALRVSAVVWAFGFLLGLIISALDSRGGPEITDELINIYYWIQAVAMSMGIYALSRRIDHWRPLLRWSLIILAGFVCAVVQTFVDLAGYYWLAHTFYPQWKNWATFEIPRMGGVMILYSWTFLLNITLFWAMSLNEKTREQARRASEAEAATQRAQLAALRLQLNPHFLFNTLNAISTLVMERDCDRADRMIERLSEFLRASLSTHLDAPILLGEELDTIQAYLEIEAVRFESRLEVACHCPEALRDALVPGFMLQPLVENAMKYAVAPALRPVKVLISATDDGADLVLRVADDGDLVDPSLSLSGAGVGLANTRARLDNLYGERGVLTAGRTPAGYVAEVRLPKILSRGSARTSEGTPA